MTEHSTSKHFNLSLNVLPLVLVSSILFAPLYTSAEIVSIPIGQQGNTQQIDKPALGMTMDQVRQEFGSPVTQSPARGTPPITRWEYNQFVTYFENNIVIHSVTKHQRKD